MLLQLNDTLAVNPDQVADMRLVPHERDDPSIIITMADGDRHIVGKGNMSVMQARFHEIISVFIKHYKQTRVDVLN